MYVNVCGSMFVYNRDVTMGQLYCMLLIAIIKEHVMYLKPVSS